MENELMKLLQEHFKEDTSDEALKIIEKASEVTKSYEEQNKELQTKYDNLDKQWREKFKSRFFEGVSNPHNEEPKKKEDDDSDNLTYDKLFK